MIFPGWGRDGETIIYDRTAFLKVRNEIEEISRWTYSGETDALLLDYVYRLPKGPGEFSFKHCVQLPVEVLIRTARMPNIDTFMHEIIVAAKEIWPPNDKSAIWRLSDRLGLRRGKRSLLDVFLGKPLVRDFAKIFGDLKWFAVRDLLQPTL